MVVIKRVTPRYDPKQDRIGLTVQDVKDQVLLLWLTQRLANRLAAALSGWLDEDVKVSASEQQQPQPLSDPVLQPLSDPVSKLPSQLPSSLHTWEQWAARSKMKPGRPVDRAKAQGEALLNEIDLARGSKGYTVTFKWEPTGAARLVLDPTQVRQWLILLYRQFRLAEWPKHAWPNWIILDEENDLPRGARHEVN